METVSGLWRRFIFMFLDDGNCFFRGVKLDVRPSRRFFTEAFTEGEFHASEPFYQAFTDTYMAFTGGRRESLSLEYRNSIYFQSHRNP